MQVPRGQTVRPRRAGLALLAVAILLVSLGISGSPARAVDDPARYKGSIPYQNRSVEYLIEIPGNWNGTLFLYSHGISHYTLYAAVSGDQFTRNWLLEHGYGLAGGSYADPSYEPGLQYPAQLAVLDAFEGIVGRQPSRVIAWGHSGGGHVVGALVEFAAQRFAGAVAMCPLGLAGGVGRFNEQLDHMFVLKTLLGFSRPLVNIGFGKGQLSGFQNEELALLQAAQTTPQGRARLALAEAMVSRPDWVNDPYATKPAATDFTTRANNEFALALGDTFADVARGRYEYRIAQAIGTYDPTTGSISGASFSWNTGVDYSVQLSRSDSADLVAALYQQASLDLAADLAQLSSAERIAADPGAVERLKAWQPILGGPRIPVATLYGVGDPYVNISESQGYEQAATDSRTSDNLRQLYLPIGGHCEFTGAEQITTIQTLLTRLDSGLWPSTDAASLNARATAMGSGANKFVGLASLNGHQQDPRFANYAPPTFLRSFNTTSINPYP